MKPYFSFVIVLSLVLAACGAPPVTPTATAPPTAAPTPDPTNDIPLPPPTQQPTISNAALLARQDLARQLNVDLSAVNIVSAERVEWPDSCLGAPGAGEGCAQVITPGYKIVLEVNGQTY